MENVRVYSDSEKRAIVAAHHKHNKEFPAGMLKIL